MMDRKLQAAQHIIANSGKFTPEQVAKANTIVAAAAVRDGGKAPRQGTVSVDRPRVDEEGRKVLLSEGAEGTVATPIKEEIDPWAKEQKRQQLNAADKPIGPVTDGLSFDPWAQEGKRDERRKNLARHARYARLRGWALDPEGYPDNPDRVTITPDGKNYTEQDIQTLPAEDAYVVRTTGVPGEAPVQFETRGKTSAGSWLTERVFFERDNEEALRLLKSDPRLRRLALRNEDLVWNGDKPELPTAIEDGSELHKRINDAYWTLEFQKDEAAGARLIRASQEQNLSPLAKFGRTTQKHAETFVGGPLLAMDRGLSGGLLTSGVAALAGNITGLDEVERINQAREQFADEHPLMALGATIAGALSPSSVGSLGVRAANQMLPRAVAPAHSLTRNMFVGGVSGLNEGVAMGLNDTAVNGGVQPGTDTMLVGSALGGALGGGLFGLIGRGAQKLANKMESNNPDLTRVDNAGGRVGLRVQLPAKLQRFEDESLALRQGVPSVERTPLDLAARDAGNRMLRAVGETEDGLRRRLEIETAGMYAAAGDRTIPTTRFVHKLHAIAAELENSMAGNSTPFRQVLRRVAGVKYVPAGAHPFQLRSGRALFEDALRGAPETPGMVPVLTPKKITMETLDQLTDALAERAQFAASKEMPGAARWKELYGEAMALRGQFDHLPEVRQAAERMGVKSFSELKARQSDQLGNIGTLRTAVDMPGDKPIPGGLADVKLRPEQVMVSAVDEPFDVRHLSDYNEAMRKVDEVVPAADRRLFRDTTADSAQANAAVQRALQSGAVYKGPLFASQRMMRKQVDRLIRDGAYTSDKVLRANMNKAQLSLANSKKHGKLTNVVMHFEPGTESVPITPTHRISSLGRIGMGGHSKEALVPADTPFRIARYGDDGKGNVHLWLTRNMGNAGRLRYEKGLDVMGLIERQPGGTGRMQALRSAILNRASGDQREELFQAVSKLDPEVAQALTNVVGLQAAERIRRSVTHFREAGASRVISGLSTGIVKRGTDVLGAVGYGLAKSASEDLGRGIDWNELAKLRKAPKLWAYITNSANRNTPKQHGVLPERSGRLSLANGAGGRAGSQIDLERLLEVWDSTRLLLEEAMRRPSEAPGSEDQYGPPVAPETPEDERANVEDEPAYSDAGAP